MLQKSSLQVKTDLAELKQVLVWFNQVVGISLPRLILIQCQTLLAEGFTNAVRHAHCHQTPDTPIDLEVTLTETCLEIRIWDYGLPFDLAAAVNRETDSVDVFASGGRGLKLLKQMSDDVQYQRISTQQNCLLIIKNYAS